MANINVAEVKGQMERWFRTQGVGSERFQNDFVSAVNRATRKINRQAALATAIGMYAEGASTTIALSDEYIDVLEDLVALELVELGQRPAKGMEAVLVAKSRLMDDRIDDIRQDIMRQAIEADTDDETDFIGLGARG